MADMVAKTLFGLEAVLAEELSALGAGNIKILNRAVAFTGDKRLMYLANYHLRTALKILKPLKESELKDEKQLYDFVRSIGWEKYMNVDETLAVEVALKSDLYSHSGFVAQRIKDAIVDQFRDRYGRRPSVDLDAPNLRINAYIRNKSITLSLDSSGDPLYRRGYRFRQGPAPLNEVLAAGLIKISGWNGMVPFVDMMCGSGTLPIEAAMMAAGIPPGALGRVYGFQKWKDYDRKLFDGIVREKEVAAKSPVMIFASDISAEAVKLSISHAKNARVSERINFQTCDLKDYKPPVQPGILLINPPYGERLIPENINAMYSLIGDKLKKDFAGYTAWIFSGYPDAYKRVGLRPSRKIPLFNGQLECRFLCYTLYEGSKKTKTGQF